MVEYHPSKVVVVGSSLIARSYKSGAEEQEEILAQVAQLVEHFLGKEEVHGFESRLGLWF